MGIVLQANHIECLTALVVDGNRTWGHEPIGLQFFAAQAHHHHFTAKVGVQADVAQGTNGNLGAIGINRDAAAVGVLQAHHIVHIRKFGQQLRFDALHRKRHHTRHALHRGGDGQDVARADRTIGIAVTLKGVALQWWQGFGLDGSHGQVVELAG